MLTPHPSDNTRRVIEAFRLERDAAVRVLAPPPLPELPAPGQVLLVTGPSGSGKSRLLSRLKRSRSVRWVDVGRLRLARAATVDCLAPLPLEEGVGLLNRLGLGEAWTYLRVPRSLSEGQRWRLRLAAAWVAASHPPPLDAEPGLRRYDRPRPQTRRAILVADEFATPLDPVTAVVVARALRRLITGSAVAAVVATGRSDVAKALEPDLTVTCDYDTSMPATT